MRAAAKSPHLLGLLLISHFIPKTPTITMCNKTTYRTHKRVLSVVRTESVGSVQARGMSYVSGSHYDLHDVVQFIQV